MDSTFRIDNKELNLQKIQEKKKNSIIIKNNINNNENNNKKRDFKDIIFKNIIKKENIINDKNDKIIEKQNKEYEIKKSTSHKEFEIYDKIVVLIINNLIIINLMLFKLIIIIIEILLI